MAFIYLFTVLWCSAKTCKINQMVHYVLCLLRSEAEICDMFASFTPGFGKRVKLRLKGELALNKVFTDFLSDTCSTCGFFFLCSFSAVRLRIPLQKTMLCSHATDSLEHMVRQQVYYIRVPNAGHVTYALYNTH